MDLLWLADFKMHFTFESALHTHTQPYKYLTIEPVLVLLGVGLSLCR